MTDLKRLGGWKSTSVAEGYIAESIKHKRKTSKQISDVIAGPSNADDHEINDEPVVKQNKIKVAATGRSNIQNISDLSSHADKESLKILSSNNINIYFRK